MITTRYDETDTITSHYTIGQAHDHAREASAATHTADTAAAVTEHALAAGEFATAAGDTASVEALRTLRLLEQHHQRLSHILRVSLERSAAEASKKNEAQAEKEKELSEKGIENDKPAPLGTATTTTSVSGVVTRGEFTGGSDGAVATVAPAGDSPLKALRSAAGVPVPAGAAGQPLAGATPSQQPTQANPHRRYPPSRELSSSIANNLASARGIRGNGSPGPVAGTTTSSRHGHNQRGQPAAPSVSNDLAPGSLDGSPGRGSRAQMQTVLQQTQTKPSWVPPSLQTPQSQQPQMFVGTDADEVDSDSGEAKADDGFSRFYNRFGSIINRLSAPLAFAGLPLVAEEPAPEEVSTPAPQQTQERPARGQQKQHQNAKQQEGQRAPSRSRATSQLSNIAASAYSYYNSYGGSGNAEPDLSQIYSHAALRAIGASGGNPNDSFYVVPKTGHTASYANILSFDQKEKRRMAASIHGGDDLADLKNAPIAEEDDQDDFVDAKERPTQVQKSSRASGSRMHNAKSSAPDHVLEELYTENQGLKDMLDKLSRRLHAFEASAQSSHMALQESMRLNIDGVDSDNAVGKNLEEELARVMARLEESERERAHQEKTLQKYRDKWEKLKAGAKARREAQGPV
ncbi:hypothetical protein F503_01675 [Ophiostoma piceae UAMH 11346]|uniref:Uncharacterized protein n=1 Tax=Ophiostoma piceae (strain UAMH 11346) TaxID=1262450 RepID=S3BPF4_OPHP1|nr:hypothetical protein F503_01675 [Ophiostoma piceae UAMH 11346]